MVVRGNLESMRDVSPQEAYRGFDSAARHFLKTTGEQFLAAWQAGVFATQTIRLGCWRLLAWLLDFSTIRTC